MKLPARCLLAAILGGMAHSSHADDALTQTTMSLHSAGKPVAGLIFPIGTKIELSAVANAMESGAHHARFTGNVQGRFTPPAGQQIIVFGEELVLSTEAISAERARAVRDIEAMAGADQLYRGWSSSGDLTPAEWQQQMALDSANMTRLAQIIAAYGWPGLRFAGSAWNRWPTTRNALAWIMFPRKPKNGPWPNSGCLISPARTSPSSRCPWCGSASARIARPRSAVLPA